MSKQDNISAVSERPRESYLSRLFLIVGLGLVAWPLGYFTIGITSKMGGFFYAIESLFFRPDLIGKGDFMITVPIEPLTYWFATVSLTVGLLLIILPRWIER